MRELVDAGFFIYLKLGQSLQVVFEKKKMEALQLFVDFHHL